MVIDLRESITEHNNSILIVENEGIRELLEMKLSSKGYVCYEAINNEQVISKINDNRIALVILDIDTKGISAIELLSLIKESHPDTAIVVATPVGGTSIGIECKESGADEYITKPYILEEVAVTVDKVLEKRRIENLKERYQRQLQEIVGEQTEKIRNSFFQAVTALVHALEAKDVYTSGHSQRVADLSVDIGNNMLLSQSVIEKIRMAGLVHDIGKIGIKEYILNKPTGLTDEEYKQVRNHPEIGEYILAPIVNDAEILQLVRNHHERFDGTGYPDRLKGNQIPLGTRILAVADAYDAMTSDRPYRKAMNSETAFQEIRSKMGTQFDPEIVTILFQVDIQKSFTGFNYPLVTNP